MHNAPPASSNENATEGSLFIKALNVLVEINDVPQNALAEHAGVSQGYVSKILCGKQLPKEHLRERLAEYFNLSYREMLDMGRDPSPSDGSEAYSIPFPGSDPASRLDAVREDPSFTLGDVGGPPPRRNHALLASLLRDFKSREIQNRSYTEIPLREATGSMGGGSTETGTRAITYLSFRTEWIRAKGNPEYMSVIRAFGDSMSPTIPDGSVVLVDESRRQFVKNKVFYIRHNAQMYIKRLVGTPADIAIVSDQDGSSLPLQPGEDFEIIGRCIWTARDIE
ncbi:helix-turn-helix transcriptional regulator [Desulfovibrio sulfodismutans]|uniref:Helix-turn-helix transcriptional regulator n=1 Tax=Desulfolutivibrio sulfodismutans TaxID=63561 RepID=A0A7K3NN01_9BACT|nr:XRE family transcriptional regulator [Desulfolutivibrio sulfodismutans]NDY56579.1 helix-turn-helix transcriptional regulator [Desulfolutivibrio sulfodismutans]QLA13037.1 XRE family transcriptional regulator [Desulfolutivibrio sulfodismutans DSM 3696]